MGRTSSVLESTSNYNYILEKEMILNLKFVIEKKILKYKRVYQEQLKKCQHNS